MAERKKVGEGPKEINIPKINREKRIELPTYDKVKKVRGIFRNLEYPGTGISIPFRAGWKGPVRQFDLFDGLEYVIPETLAKHLNENCAYKTYKWVAQDGSEVTAKPTMPGYTKEVDKKTHRFLFQVSGSE